MKIYDVQDYKYVKEIVEIHMNTFVGFFLTFLGRGFLRTLYKGFIEHPQSGIIIALENDKLIGFCAFSENLSGFYNYLVRKKLLQFAGYAMMAVVKKPKVLFRLLRAFNYSNESKREESYMELSSIGVSPEDKNRGIGSKMIRYLYDISDKNRFKYIKLETDKDDNEGANYFYLKNGFVLDHSFRTPEGRNMNEYRLYFEGK